MKAPDPAYPSPWHSFSNAPPVLAAFLAILFFACTAYWNSLDVPFYLDDFRNISENPHTRVTALSLETLADAAFKSPSFSRPVANLSFALNYFFHKQRVGGYHLINIIIHVLSALFLYLLFAVTLVLAGKKGDRTASSLRSLALAAALLWLVHPVQTQSVTYIVQRMTSMAAMFYLLSLLLYVKGRLESRSGPSLLWFCGSLLAGLCAVFSKEHAASLPFFIFLYEWYFFQDLEPSWLKSKAPVLFGVFLLFIGLAFLFTGGHPLSAVLDTYAHRDFSLVQRLLTEFRVIAIYISLLLLPHPARLSLEYDLALSTSLFEPVTTLAALLLLAALLALAFVAARENRLLSFAIIWFLGTLAIESSVIGLEIVFEHRLYLPSMFFFLCAAAFGSRCLHGPRTRTAVLIMFLLLFAFWTHERNEAWRDPVRFWSDAARKAPANVRVHNNLSVELRKKGEYQAALASSFEALRLKPDFVNAHVNLGNIYLDLKSYDMAIAQFSKALALKPDYSEVYVNLGNAYKAKGETEKAMGAFRRGLLEAPDNIRAMVNLASAQASTGRFDEAVSLFHRALALSPDNPDIHFNLAVAYRALGRYDQATAALHAVLRLNRDDTGARRLLGELQRKRNSPPP